jgi:hypothetical protein
MTFPQDVLDLVLVEEERYEAEDHDATEVALPSPRLAEDAACGPVRTLGPDSAAPDEAAEVAPEEQPEAPLGGAGAAGGGAAAAAAPPAATLVTVSHLAGVPLRYERGQPFGPTSFRVNATFLSTLEDTVRVVTERAPQQFGPLQNLVSAGMLVDKPGMHGLGRACDWDCWRFRHVEIAPVRRDHASDSVAVRRRYWALAALCRSQSAYVLHAEFNAAHQDHIHQDNGATMPFDANSGTAVKLVQAVCNEIFDASPRLSVDGSFGQKTRDALTAALQAVHLDSDVSDGAIWRKFLRRAGRLGFTLSV